MIASLAAFGQLASVEQDLCVDRPTIAAFGKTCAQAVAAGECWSENADGTNGRPETQAYCPKSCADWVAANGPVYASGHGDLPAGTEWKPCSKESLCMDNNRMMTWYG